MKISKILFSSFILAALYSCDDNKMEWGRDPAYGEVSEDELPKDETVDNDEIDEEINGLKDYIPEGSNFKLGIGMGMDLFTYDRERNPIAVANFNDVAAGYAMKHGPMIKSDGTINITYQLNDFLAEANNNNMSVFGHCLIWHSNQNATYLKSLVESARNPQDEDAEVTFQTVKEFTFESDDDINYGKGGWHSISSKSNVSLSDAGAGYGGSGKCLLLTETEGLANVWQTQAAIEYPIKSGVTYRISFYAKATNTSGENFSFYISSSKGDPQQYGPTYTIGADWSPYSFEVKVTGSYDKFIITHGHLEGTLYIDDFKIEEQVIQESQDSEEEKAQRVEDAVKEHMKYWIDEMITHCYTTGGVTGWDVVNEPMDDGNPDELKTTPDSDVPDDAFYWQDYFIEPRQYAYWAFRYAREKYEELGVTDPKLFINDYNLEYDNDKCQGIIDYVNEIEDLEIDGVKCKVDGIATQMHISYNSNKDRIRTMFQMLNQTGKLIKISELDVKLPESESHTAEQYQQQADMYEYVINTYFEEINPAQQYGITIWSLSDKADEHEYWLPNQAPNLWDENLQPKEAYYSVAKALKKAFSPETTEDSTEESAE